MNRTDQPGKSAPNLVSVPAESKSATNIIDRVSSNPNLTSTSVQPGKSPPNEEPPVAVLNERVVPENALLPRTWCQRCTPRDLYFRNWLD